MKRTSSFVAITTEGGLLPADFLSELLSPKDDIDGLTPTSYNLADGERISEQVNRSWNRLKGRWADFKKAISEKPADEFTTTETRNRWLQPLFQELGYGQRLIKAKPIEIDGRTYPVSHAWNHVPMHLVGAHIDLDHRTPGAVGAAKASPHSLVQQALNASDRYLWGIVSNGLNLRLLRDNIALTRQAQVEWDLAAIFDGDLYSEFFLLWLVVHQSRFDADRPEQCWLEQWKKTAADKGLRALDKLRLGVARAIEALGVGLLSHQRNKALKLKLSKGELTPQDFYRQVLRVIYRIMFLLVAEDRDLLHSPLPTADDKDTFNRAVRARQRYRDFYSVGRLRHLTLVHAGTPHTDLWQTFQFVSERLGANEGCPELALTPLGSFLWDTSRSTPDLNDGLVSNQQFIAAAHALAFVQDGSIRRLVDYKNLGSEELGSVYEGLLELHPRINADAGTFELNVMVGNERKSSGSYYTPDSLVQSLLDSALNPAIADAIRGKEREAVIEALLNLKICDPAAGSGHFLIAASHRLAKHVAVARSGEAEPGPTIIRTALRDVIGRCIYGVDINPMAVELCKVSLWMEAVEPGKPLSFLDHHIQCGDSLLGATPALMAKGIPDEAFQPIEGDDSTLSAEYKKQNKRERQQETLHGFHGEYWEHLSYLTNNIAQISSLPDEGLEDVQTKEQKYVELLHSTTYQFGRLLADAWCSAFVWKKSATAAGGFDYPITNEVFRRIERNPQDAPKWMLDEIVRLAEQYKFFHWHLAFPDVFKVAPPGVSPENELCGWNGGFDVSLGNPPWEKVELMQREWFDSTDLTTVPAGRHKEEFLDQIRKSHPLLHKAYLASIRIVDGERSFIQHTGRFPLCGRGRINRYAAFAETTLHLVCIGGLIGFVLPPGIATDDSTKFFIQELVENDWLSSFFAFTNRGYIFPGIESTLSFSLITYGKRKCYEIRIAAQLWQVEHMADPGRVYTLDGAAIKKINPNTLNLPILQSARDAEIVIAIHSRVPVFQSDALTGSRAYSIEFRQGLFNMTSDKRFFRTLEQLKEEGYELDSFIFRKASESYLPLYEAKLTSQYNHRHGTFDGVPAAERFGTRAQTIKPTGDNLADRYWHVLPRYWVHSKVVEKVAPRGWHNEWFLGFRNAISAVADSRSVAFVIIPRVAVGNSMPLVFCNGTANDSAMMLGNFNSFVLDYVARQKASGGNLNFYVVKQLPVLAPTSFSNPCAWGRQGQTVQAWILPRVLELTYTAWDLEAFAQDCGWSAAPFRWDDERRFLLRCELDAAFFHLYGLTCDEAAHILDTFPIIRRKDEGRFNGDYRTKRVILEIYDEMVSASTKRLPYNTRLNPPPADISVAHRQSYRSLPLMLPQGLRFPQVDHKVYAMRIILSLLNLFANRMEVSTLMIACGLLAKPERFRTFARDVGPDIIAAWSRSFSDTFDPKLFLPTIDELVRRGELRLERDSQKFIVNRVGRTNIVIDPFIEFDALLALRVESSLSDTERQSILPMASSQELEGRFKVA